MHENILQLGKGSIEQPGNLNHTLLTADIYYTSWVTWGDGFPE